VHAAEHVAVVPVDGEGVVDLAVAALLVLEQQGGVVEGGELDEPVVAVPEHAPPGDGGGVIRQVAAAAAGDDEDGAVHGPGVAGRLLGHALVLVHGAGALVVVDVAEEGDVDAVLLPQLLQALAALGLLVRALHRVPRVGGVAQHAVRREDEPRLVLPVHRREAVLDPLVLRRALPPVVLRVGDAEPEHAVVHLVPEVGPVLGRVVVVGLRRHAAGILHVEEPAAVGPVPLVVAARDHVGLPGGDGLYLGRELIPLRDVAVGVGQVADVEHDVVVVQILNQRVGRVQRPRLVVGELVRPVPLSLINKLTGVIKSPQYFIAVSAPLQHCASCQKRKRTLDHLSHVTENNDALKRVLPRGTCSACPRRRIRPAAHARSCSST
jgi:hypothetical protein